ncbi:TPA: hypothetical protein N0F65_006635 [Lagenidium giganteum]|uniref:WW domain-containing protein n=1 Tax=Lagenidium giganteum TaxID=4803 RepID=A0AAV2ZAD1_9STRA|nr:TPA: hypothetical protein N0F65_006635 [Lagenidium giganteum]
MEHDEGVTPINADWEQRFDQESGNYYFFNTRTGESSWHLPDLAASSTSTDDSANWVETEDKHGVACFINTVTQELWYPDNATEAAHADAAMAPSPTVPAKAPSTAEQMERLNRLLSGEIDDDNDAEGDAAIGADVAPDAAAPDATASAPVLDNEGHAMVEMEINPDMPWIMLIHEADGTPYYYNQVTYECVWDAPAEFLAYHQLDMNAYVEAAAADSSATEVAVEQTTTQVPEITAMTPEFHERVKLAVETATKTPLGTGRLMLVRTPTEKLVSGRRAGESASPTSRRPAENESEDDNSTRRDKVDGGAIQLSDKEQSSIVEATELQRRLITEQAALTIQCCVRCFVARRRVARRRILVQGRKAQAAVATAQARAAAETRLEDSQATARVAAEVAADAVAQPAARMVDEAQPSPETFQQILSEPSALLAAGIEEKAELVTILTSGREMAPAESPGLKTATTPILDGEGAVAVEDAADKEELAVVDPPLVSIEDAAAATNQDSQVEDTATAEATAQEVSATTAQSSNINASELAPTPRSTPIEETHSKEEPRQPASSKPVPAALMIPRLLPQAKTRPKNRSAKPAAAADGGIKRKSVESLLAAYHEHREKLKGTSEADKAAVRQRMQAAQARERHAWAAQVADWQRVYNESSLQFHQDRSNAIAHRERELIHREQTRHAITTERQQVEDNHLRAQHTSIWAAVEQSRRGHRASTAAIWHEKLHNEVVRAGDHELLTNDLMHERLRAVHDRVDHLHDQHERLAHALEKIELFLVSDDLHLGSHKKALQAKYASKQRVLLQEMLARLHYWQQQSLAFDDSPHAAADVNGSTYWTRVRHHFAKLELAELQKRALDDFRYSDGDSLLHKAVWNGCVDQVQLLLSLGMSVNMVDNSACLWTPLHEAARAGDVEIAALLVQHGAQLDAVDSSGDSPLHVACRGGWTPIVRLLITAAEYDSHDDAEREAQEGIALAEASNNNNDTNNGDASHAGANERKHAQLHASLREYFHLRNYKQHRAMELAKLPSLVEYLHGEQHPSCLLMFVRVGNDRCRFDWDW